MDAREAARPVAEKVALPLGVELLDVRWTGGGSSRTLRIVVDRTGGVSVQTCADFSRQFDLLWEAENARPRDFGLEVTSPGPDRPLATERDFVRVVGRWIEVQYTGEQARRTVTGQVHSCADGLLHLRCLGGSSGDEETEMTIPLASIERAKVLFLIGAPKPNTGKKSLRRSKR